ncbi:unnamed protein product [Brachionus calyciflorus]|uniref:Uncharacterized protein n=1 Tax=Brachionus calyciflorus TaxID=104777 RepID=A0A813MA92_9BILA|nr:unnamed protein product [Brachionus calyciflorus]
MIWREKTKKIDYYIDEDEKTKALQYKSGFCYNLINFFSKNLSFSSITLAIVNISLGVFYAVLEWYWIVVWFTFLGANIFLYIVLEIWKNNRKSSRRKSNNKDDDSDSDEEFSLSKASSTQQLKPGSNSDNIRMEPFRYTNPTRQSFKNQKISNVNANYSIDESISKDSNHRAQSDRLNYSQKINISYIGDGDYESELKYVTAKKSALKEKIESLTSSPISSIGIINQVNSPQQTPRNDYSYKNVKY